jgi:hypothetical protein
VLGIGSVRSGPTYEGLYKGDYVHPNPERPRRRKAAESARALRAKRNTRRKRVVRKRA